MATLKEILAEKIPALREERRQVIADFGDEVISQVTVAQAFGGMRGIKGMVCDTSVVEPERGLLIRGRTIAELVDRLPEEIFFLLCTGDLPDAEALRSLQRDLFERSAVPEYVWKILKDLPGDSHPMDMFCSAILVLERESLFRKRYTEGMHKDDYWDPTYEDAISLIAKIPVLAAGVYRIRFKMGDPIPRDPALDWGGAFAAMFGTPDPAGKFANMMRLYLTLHSDHEGGNVSANTCHTVGSALSDPFYAVSAGLSGLAGPLHGLAAQECLRFVMAIKETFGGVPTDAQLAEYVEQTLADGKVVPGYGHAVLRITDPRFTALHEFGKKECADDPIFQIVDRCQAVIPGVLEKQGKVKSPHPNVDAGSGALLHHFGVVEPSYYTVVFGVSRAMGMLSQLILNRALGTPITRPKSVSTEWIKAQMPVEVTVRDARTPVRK